MRCDNIKVNLSIPVKINEPDGNGIMYTEEAIRKACENATGQPIIQYNDNGEDVVIGIANDVSYMNGFINVEATAWHGGTTELVDKLVNKTITSFRIKSFGICE